MMRTLAIVPARAGSTRVPEKNLRLLGGVPLVIRALRAAQGAALVHRTVVSSDDDRVLDLVADVDAAACLRRPPELATDTSPAIDYVRHALAAIDAGDEFEAVVIVQPSSPLTLSPDIDATLALLASSGADSAVTVMELDHAVHPWKLKTLEGNRLLPYLQDEQNRMMSYQLPRLYVRNGAVYASRRKTVEAGDLLGSDSRAVVMPRSRSIDINTENDLDFATFLFESGRASAQR